MFHRDLLYLIFVFTFLLTRRIFSIECPGPNKRLFSKAEL